MRKMRRRNTFDCVQIIGIYVRLSRPALLMVCAGSRKEITGMKLSGRIHACIFIDAFLSFLSKQRQIDKITNCNHYSPIENLSISSFSPNPLRFYAGHQLSFCLPVSFSPSRISTNFASFCPLHHFTSQSGAPLIITHTLEKRMLLAPYRETGRKEQREKEGLEGTEEEGHS